MLDIVETAGESAQYILERRRLRSTAIRRGRKPNLGKIVNDILDKAGIQRWSKPFVSMRSSCETDLAEEYPIQVVTAWLGNSPQVAQKHYLKVRPEHFERAILGGIEREKSDSGNSRQFKSETGLKGIEKRIESTEISPATAARENPNPYKTRYTTQEVIMGNPAKSGKTTRQGLEP